MSVRRDNEGLQDCSTTSYDVWFGKVQEADLEVAEQKILRLSLGEKNTSEGQLGSSGLEIK